jgi:hypothetical protein
VQAWTLNDLKNESVVVGFDAVGIPIWLSYLEMAIMCEQADRDIFTYCISYKFKKAKE